MFKKLISIVSIFFMLVTSSLAMDAYYATKAYAGVASFVSAGLAGQNDVVSGMGPGEYHTQGENIYTLGYTNVRFNTAGQNLQLFSITPPNFSIGCSGISAEWGAFAMLGSELMQVLSSIIQSGQVLVFAFNMVLGVLCKQCESIMTQIESIANKLNGLNFNSCQAAEAMGNLAGAELGNMIGETGVAGATNSFADSVNSALGSVSSAVGSFVNDANGVMNCASTQQGAQQLVETGFKSCGEAAAGKKFMLGSLLRNTLTHAHIGLIEGSAPGNGGTDDLIGILRGSMIGDIVGYSSTSKTSDMVVKYVPPSAPLGNDISSGNPSLSNLFQVLMFGSKNMSSITIQPLNGSFLNTASLSQIEQGPSADCFPGFYFYYDYYLQNVENYYFGSPLPSNTSSLCGNATITSLNQQQIYNFVANSTMPVMLILKLAYVNQDPALVNTAAKAMAAGYARSLFGDILQSVTTNVMAAKNINHKNKLKLWNEYVGKIRVIQHSLNNGYVREESRLASQINTVNYYAKLNKDWVSTLSNYGLQGAGGFNP